MVDIGSICPKCGGVVERDERDLFGEAYPVDVSRGPSNEALAGYWTVLGRMSQQVLCKTTDIPRKTVLEFEGAGMPFLDQAESGRAKFYDFMVVFKWMRRRWQVGDDDADGGDDGAFTGRDGELRRKRHWDANMAQLEYEKAIGTVVDARTVEGWWGQVLTDLRVRLGTVGDVVASRLKALTADEVSARVTELVEEILNEAASHYADLSGGEAVGAVELERCDTEAVDIAESEDALVGGTD